MQFECVAAVGPFCAFNHLGTILCFQSSCNSQEFAQSDHHVGRPDIYHTVSLKFWMFSLVTPLTGVLWGHMTHKNVVLGLCIEIDCLSMFWVATLDVVLFEQDRKIHLRVNSPKQTSRSAIVMVQTWPISGDFFFFWSAQSGLSKRTLHGTRKYT